MTAGTLERRPAASRGRTELGWLDSWHSFSFGGYHDPQRMGWGNLRVINEDRIAPGTGFGLHGHRDMEILSYVLHGELSHTDSMGNVSLIPPGDIQRMSAGTGVRHSERNHAAGSSTHFLQIWIEPRKLGIPPSYQQRSLPPTALRGQLCLIAAGDDAPAAVSLNADARLYAGYFDGDEQAQLTLSADRKGWVQVLHGSVQVNGQSLHAGDALATEAVTQLRFTQARQAQLLVFDLAP